MDWKSTKTIFILSFLILNIFLGYQLSVKLQQNNIQYIADLPLEKQLEDNNINYKDELPDYKAKQTLISGQRAPFSPADLNTSKEVKLDKDKSANDMLVYSLKKPLKVTESNVVDEVSAFLKEEVYRGNEYSFYKKDTTSKTVWFTQSYDGKPILFDSKSKDMPGGMVKFHWNDTGEVRGFEQTFLSIYRQGTPQEIISPMKAIGRLFKTGYLSNGEKIKKVQLGYYSLANVEDVQVYVPTWSVETENGHYLVNATDSSIQQIDREGNEES
ncbi:hypothetical protein A374_07256 [Fictibacillus macauensis ZFHKF-1]|uniref:Regulatory protein YycH-like domain-containing protein n=1 Tax=Fictibacillus macauensis ZFHKF-1 TaxID=1196324 RepID=I8AKK3_9BACL|nr:two-component system regulatory protein YycI [Fictibacillus macauensis]EIT86099.1 hypothetical protein A374_07256 [Fictibacillus macauensis ZFHKF-1]